MGHIQAAIQAVQKRSRPNSGVERRSGDGNHLHPAAPWVIEPAEELQLLFAVQGLHISKNQRPSAAATPQRTGSCKYGVTSRTKACVASGGPLRRTFGCASRRIDQSSSGRTRKPVPCVDRAGTTVVFEGTMAVECIRLPARKQSTLRNF